MKMPTSSHAGHSRHVGDAVLGGDKGWVRKELVKDAPGDPALPTGPASRSEQAGVNNGISGDGVLDAGTRQRIYFDMKVDYAVKQIKSLLG